MRENKIATNLNELAANISNVLNIIFAQVSGFRCHISILNFSKLVECLFGPPSYGGSSKITVVCLSVRQFSIFLRNGSLVLSDFLHDGT